MRIAILITTFLRDKLLYETVQSVLDNWNDEYVLMVADQGNATQEKTDYFSKTLADKNKTVIYVKLPYDCGLSRARNFLVQMAMELKIPYCLLSADSLKLTSKYDLSAITSFLECDKDRGIVGLDIKDRIPWEWDLAFKKEEAFILSTPRRMPLIHNGVCFQPIDICRNFFIAKTECLSQTRWDDQLKIAEHEDFFYRLKTDTTFKVFFTKSIQCIYAGKTKAPEYDAMRHGRWSEYIQLLKNKYHMKGWVRRG